MKYFTSEDFDKSAARAARLNAIMESEKATAWQAITASFVEAASVTLVGAASGHESETLTKEQFMEMAGEVYDEEKTRIEAIKTIGVDKLNALNQAKGLFDKLRGR